MVVSYHAWSQRVSGGVDIFLLISAFLMTLSFLGKAEDGRPFALLQHWARHFSRLLPAVAVVITGTLMASYLFVPQVRWAGILHQAWAALLYFQNWLLAAEATDYYADHATASPFQHFWSLSIQGQVFIIWPLLFALAAAVAGALRIRFRPVVLTIFGTLTMSSLAFSIHRTLTDQLDAYFDTRTRLWEFGLGTLLALALPYLRLPRGIAVAAGWAGLAAMLSCGLILNVEGVFPGYAALWPLGAAALIIIAGNTGSRYGVDRILSLKPLVKLGEISYALYLWHWPVLIIYLVWRGREDVGPLGGVAIVGLSIVLAWATTQLIEKPLRSGKPAGSNLLRPAIIIAVSLAFVAAPVAAWQQYLHSQQEQAALQTARENPGAESLLPGFVNESTPGHPVMPARMENEWGSLPATCQGIFKPDGNLQERCSINAADENPVKTILVIGNSHAEQWLGALEPIAEARQYRLIALLQGGCSFGAGPELRTPECIGFNKASMAYALKLKPDAVFTIATLTSPTDAFDLPVPGLASYAEQLMDAGIEVLGIRGTPRFDFNVLECAQKLGAFHEKCNQPRTSKLADEPPLTAFAAPAPNLRFMDMTDLICPADACPAIIGNVYVYMDGMHLTTTYTATTLREFDARFHSLLGWPAA